MNFSDFFNPESLQKMQGLMHDMQEKIREIKATGEAGGGIVKITLNGSFECIHIDIDPIAIDMNDLSGLKALIKSAHHAATEKLRAMLPSQSNASSEELRKIFHPNEKK